MVSDQIIHNNNQRSDDWELFCHRQNMIQGKEIKLIEWKFLPYKQHIKELC